MGAILSSSLLALVEQSRESILRRDTSLLELLVYESVRLKASVVSEDEKETGKRMVLNFGHTFGHVIEAVTGQKHGFAIAAGMEISASVSVMEGLLAEADSKYLVKLLRDFNLLIENNVTPETYARMIISDKKRSGEDISFILLESPGNAVIRKIPLKKLTDYCHSIKFRQ
jgi:3-dehydroquinate synthase